MSAETVALKPCPFCDGEPMFGTDSDGAHGISCKVCGAGTRGFYPLKDDVRDLVIETWNRRAALSAPPAEPTQAYTEPAPPVDKSKPKHKRRWVSVKTRLPTWVERDASPCVLNGQTIAPALSSRRVLVSIIEAGQPCVSTDKLVALEGSEPWWDRYGQRVTHWRPFPRPPESVE